MGFRLPRVVSAKKLLQRSLSNTNKAAAMAFDVPKGHLAIYVGENEKKRFVIPVSLLNHHSFQELLSQALKKNFDLLIRWAVSQFPVQKMPSLISSLN